MEGPRQMQRVQLPTGVIWAEVEQIGDVPLRRDVSAQEGVPPQSIEVVREAIKGLGQVVQEALAGVKPDKASVEFGLEMGVESGQLTALLVKARVKRTSRSL